MSALNQVKDATEAAELKKQNESSINNFYRTKMVVKSLDEKGEEVEIVVGYFNVFKNASIVKTIANAIELKYPELSVKEFEEKIIKVLNKNLPKWGFELTMLETKPKLDLDIDLEDI